MQNTNIVARIVEQRKIDIENKGFGFGHSIPSERKRPIVPFMQSKGVILEVKRASPSKGDIAPDLNAVETALTYRKNGAKAISCLTEENYFKGSLKDLMAICKEVQDVAVLRKDFLIEEEEIEISYRCGADAVLLISGILSQEKLISMAGKCASLGIRALLEVRTQEDAYKAIEAHKAYPETIVFGVNSRNLKDFSIDLLAPAMLKQELGGKVIFESGICTAEASRLIAQMGFTGLLLGEFAARNPSKAVEFVKAFCNGCQVSNPCADFNLKLALKIKKHQTDAKKNKRPMVKICGLTRGQDVDLAIKLGADFIGFIFASGFERSIYGQRFDSIKEKLSSYTDVVKVAVITDTESSEAKYAIQMVKDGVLDCLQFHGLSYNNIRAELLSLPHYFAVTDSASIDASAIRTLSDYGEVRILQDCKGHEYCKQVPLWIAGGITVDNVQNLIKTYNPELIDISGGIESNSRQKGIKDEQLLEKLFNLIEN